MTSIRTPSSSRTRKADGSRHGRIGGPVEPAERVLPTTFTYLARQEAANTRLAIPNTSNSRPQQSRLPQLSTSRRPSASSSTRPSPNQDDQSWSSASSVTARSNTSGVKEKETTPAQTRTVLRRKPTGISRIAVSSQAKSTPEAAKSGSSSIGTRFNASNEAGRADLANKREDSRDDPERTSTENTLGYVYPELDRYRGIDTTASSRNGLVLEVPHRLATDLPPPTPLFSGASSQSQLSTFSASPSTRWSESPGPGPYSRDTTPTSMSSQSPGLVAPMRLPTAKLRQGSPADSRPPVTRRRAASISKDPEQFGSDPTGLAAVREALTSSSSNSTVRAEERTDRRKISAVQPSTADITGRRPPHKLQKSQKETSSPPKTSRMPGNRTMRSPSPAKSARPSLEHSNGSVSSLQARPAMPSRPSRDGAPDLYSQLGGPMPVIHSNLSTSTVPERRQSGQLLPSTLPRKPEYASSMERITPIRSTSNDACITSQNNTNQQGAPTTRTPSPSVPSFRSRFPIFGKKQKSAAEEAKSINLERTPRKGPAAGTGHEGYGRLGAVKRRSSGGVPVSRGVAGAVPSSDSLPNTSATDTFLLERLNPVTIAGGRIVENRNDSTEIYQAAHDNSTQSSRPSLDSRKGSDASAASREEFRSMMAASPVLKAAPKTRRPSDGSDLEPVSMQATLAFRRSVQRGHSPEKAAAKIPKPILTRGFTSSSINSVDSTVFTEDSCSVSESFKQDGVSALAQGPNKLRKRARSPRKWNLFGKSHGSSDAKEQSKLATASRRKDSSSKPAAFYTMMDSSEQEDNDELPMEDIIQEIEVLKTRELMMKTSEVRLSVELATRSNRPTDLNKDGKPPAGDQQLPLGPAPQSFVVEDNHTRVAPNLKAQSHATTDLEINPKQSRLPQIGRIPKVVTSRPEKRSPQSFSRPFNRNSVQTPKSTDRADQSHQKMHSNPSQPLLTPEAVCDDATDFECSEDEEVHEGLAIPRDEFIAFSPRKNSETTCTSTSSYVDHTAVAPQPSAPLDEDEIWDEYNDFIGEPPLSATSSHGSPFHMEGYESRLIRQRFGKTMESPTIKFHPSREMSSPRDMSSPREMSAPKNERESLENGKAFTASSHYSADMMTRINAAFRFGPDSPSTPHSVSEPVTDCGKDNDTTQDKIDTTVTSTTIGTDKVKLPTLGSDKHSSYSETNSTTARNSSNSSRSSQESPLSQVNLRVGSMTVSKWLTFGQVLFSPVREDLVNVVGSLKRHSILVVDGLGNDDWSFYAAETYPAATFFNLSPRAPIPKDQKSSSFPLSPPNHHQIQFTSHLDKFPFGPDTFTCVVFRFPAAAPEAHYRNVISESRRVLKPGGYIELSVLDADLNNVGTRTRRATRQLKERVAAKHPEYSLGSTSDIMLRLLGRKGFADVKTCRVGVPVASAVTAAQVGDRSKKDERSLAEMMRDETESGDENITKMVSKVGRWWYNRCYETATSSRSIWTDKAVLVECEQWGTSLKLMVCHARIPEGTGRHASL